MLSASNVLSFRMTPGLELDANFIANPFIPAKGAYNGLFYQTNAIRHDNSGFITASVTDIGAFSGRITLAGKPISFSGRFTPDAVTQIYLPRRGTTPLTLALRFSSTGSGQLIGGLTDGSWVAEVLADRAVFNLKNHSPFPPRHTLVLPAFGDVGTPEGDSCGAATVSSAGKIAFTGAMADGTTVSQGTTVSAGGEWPFYAALYGGKGSVIGWLTFDTNNPNASLGGLVSWIKPASPALKVYTNGFATESTMVGSTYVFSPTNRVLTFSNGVLRFSGGGVPSTPVSYDVGLSSSSKIVSTNGTALTMSITTASGLFSGNWKPPGTNVALSFRGALLQQRDSGSGFFVNRNVGGKVEFTPAP